MKLSQPSFFCRTRWLTGGNGKAVPDTLEKGCRVWRKGAMLSIVLRLSIGRMRGASSSLLGHVFEAAT